MDVLNVEFLGLVLVYLPYSVNRRGSLVACAKCAERANRLPEDLTGDVTQVCHNADVLPWQIAP